jgi:hypothetical protein
MILDELRIHKYTHTKQNITILIQVSIQQSFEAEIASRYGSDTLDDIRAIACPKMPPSEAVNAYGVSQYVVQPSSLDLSLVTTIGITGRERRTIYTQLD